MLIYQKSFAVDTDSLIYVNFDDWQKIYIKNVNDTSNWSAITTSSAYSPKFSPDWQYIYYINTSDNSRIYKKNANDTSDWMIINWARASDLSISPDWQYILYAAVDDWYKLYRKNANDNLDWSPINSVQSVVWTYSPDWNYIIYSNASDWYKLYRKNANDTWNWSAINSTWSYSPIYSPDWQYIIYVDEINSRRIYKKDANDTSNWTPINSWPTICRMWDYFIDYTNDWQNIVYCNYNSWYKLYKKNANDTSDWNAINSVNSDYPSMFHPNDSWNCYNVNIWKWFTWTIVQDDLFSTLWSSWSYDIQFWSWTKNTFLISSIAWTEKFSYTFKDNWWKEVEYYNDWELCTDNSCIKDSLFWWDFWDYIYSPNANFFSNNINTKFYVNTNFDNVVWFSLSSINENFTYSLYWRPDWETSYKYLWAFKSYTWNNIWWTAFEQRWELKYYSDFYVIIPRQYIWFGRYIHHVTLWYWWEYWDLYKTVCEYNDWSYTIDWNEATQDEVQSVINEGENKWNNVFDTWSTIWDSDITQDIWNIDSDWDWTISTWEQVTAPYTIAKNLVNKFIDSLKNVWNLLKSIQNIWNIWFIENTYASNSASWILNPISEKTKSMLNWTSERDWINNVFNTIQWWVFAIAFLTIIMTFLILKIKK